MNKWIKTSEAMPENNSMVWVAGEMKYDWEADDEMDFVVGLGWLEREDEYKKYRNFHPDLPEDVDRWRTENDWWEGQPHYKITHWMKLDIPEHPTKSKIK